jgi:hypothetical protein
MIDVVGEEWRAWQEWHREFKALTGIDIDDPRCKRFVCLTQLWGEWLVQLRDTQTESEVSRLFEDAKNRAQVAKKSRTLPLR